jgi:hypothetical protein
MNERAGSANPRVKRIHYEECAARRVSATKRIVGCSQQRRPIVQEVKRPGSVIGLSGWLWPSELDYVVELGAMVSRPLSLRRLGINRSGAPRNFDEPRHLLAEEMTSSGVYCR